MHIINGSIKGLIIKYHHHINMKLTNISNLNDLILNYYFQLIHCKKYKKCMNLIKKIDYRTYDIKNNKKRVDIEYTYSIKYKLGKIESRIMHLSDYCAKCGHYLTYNNYKKCYCGMCFNIPNKNFCYCNILKYRANNKYNFINKYKNKMINSLYGYFLDYDKYNYESNIKCNFYEYMKLVLLY